MIGQGVGTAAALALREDVAPAEIMQNAGLVRAIQQQLLKDDCYLIGVRHDDAADLVQRAASISASSEQPEARAELVRSGQTRSVHGAASAAGMTREGANLWDHVLHDTDGEGQDLPVSCAPPARAFPGTPATA